MKKNYIVPAQRCVEIEGKELLLGGSIDNQTNPDEASVTLGSNTPVENTSFDAKGNNVWDTEW